MNSSFLNNKSTLWFKQSEFIPPFTDIFKSWNKQGNIRYEIPQEITQKTAQIWRILWLWQILINLSHALGAAEVAVFFFSLFFLPDFVFSYCALTDSISSFSYFSNYAYSWFRITFFWSYSSFLYFYLRISASICSSCIL